MLTQTVPYRYLVIVLVGTFMILCAFLWTRGTFDQALWKVHLNYNTCAENGMGAVMCGEDLDRYKQRLQDAGINPNP